MQDECVLDLAWIDVDATADDHEGLTVSQVEVVVRVQVPDIADRCPAAAQRVFGGRRLLGIPVIGESVPSCEVDDAGRSRSDLGTRLLQTTGGISCVDIDKLRAFEGQLMSSGSGLLRR